MSLGNLQTFTWSGSQLGRFCPKENHRKSQTSACLPRLTSFSTSNCSPFSRTCLGTSPGHKIHVAMHHPSRNLMLNLLAFFSLRYDWNTVDLTPRAVLGKIISGELRLKMPLGTPVEVAALARACIGPKEHRPDASTLVLRLKSIQPRARVFNVTTK